MVRIAFPYWLSTLCILTLLLFMGIRIDWVRSGSSSSLRHSIESQPKGARFGLLSEEIEPALKSLLARHRAAIERLRHNDFFYAGLGKGFGWGLQFGTLQARILGVCHPRETLAFVLRIVEDPKADESDYQFAVKVLGILASQGSQESLDVLLRLAQSDDRRAFLIALQGVLDCDKDGRYRVLYTRACKQDVLQAFDLGPYWIDLETEQTLQEIRTQNLKTYDFDYLTQEALERMQILKSPKRSAMLEQLVDGINPSGTWERGWSDERQAWALKVIEKDPTSHALDALRRRLEREEVAFASSTPSGIRPTHPGWTQTSDYDEYLVVYMKLGGTLNAVETERLTFYGYLGDSSERLRDLLSHWCR